MSDVAYRDNQESLRARVQELELELARRRFLIAQLVQVLRTLLHAIPQAQPSFWRSSVFGLPLAIGAGLWFYFATGGLFPSLIGGLIVAWVILGLTGYFVGQFLVRARSPGEILEMSHDLRRKNVSKELETVMKAVDEHEAVCKKLEAERDTMKTLTV